MKSVFVEQLEEGQSVDDVFLVKSSRLGETRAGKPYLLLSVADKTGEIGGPVWDNAEQVAAICEVGNFIHLRGGVSLYRDKLQLKIDGVTPVEKNRINKADFVAASRNDLGEMNNSLMKVCRSISNPFIRKLLIYFFESDSLGRMFTEAPAAKGIHHAYLGGLLEHSLSMAQVADMLASHYRGVDRSLLLAGVFLHDIGKVKELYAENGLIDYTDEGRLKGHLVMGSEMVAEAAGKIADFPAELLVQIQHLILSHHGRQEFGSPVVPMTVEAFLLNYIDELDSRMNMLEQLRMKMRSQEMSWTEYQRVLERYLYLGGFEEEEKPAPKIVDDPASRQQSLF